MADVITGTPVPALTLEQKFMAFIAGAPARFDAIEQRILDFETRAGVSAKTETATATGLDAIAASIKEAVATLESLNGDMTKANGQHKSAAATVLAFATDPVALKLAGKVISFFESLVFRK